MYEEYYGFTDKPFSLTPDPKYLYKSETHANAFELLQYAIRRREGFVVVSGDIGTGKTTLCRALLENLDPNAFTALVLNPFITEEDLLKTILIDFGVVSRDEVRRGRLARVSKQDLINTLNDFLLSLLPLRASALLIIDEAQNLPTKTLEQIRILSNLETEKEKLLQIVLAGQLNLNTLLRSPEIRQLNQRISIRYELRPLNQEEVSAYVRHRLAIAGGSNVSFTPRAIALVHRYSGGTPRLINLLCDRALLGGYSQRTSRITAELVKVAAQNLELKPVVRRWHAWPLLRLSMLAGALAIGAVAMTAFLVVRQQHGLQPIREFVRARTVGTAVVPAETVRESRAVSSFSILVGSYEDAGAAAASAAELQQLGFAPVQHAVDGGRGDKSLQLLIGRYDDLGRAQADAERIKQVAGFASARIVPN